MTFLSCEFGKGQYTFYPVKLSRFLEEKNKVRRKYQNFIRGDPYEPGQTPVPVVPMVPMVQVIRLVRVVRWGDPYEPGQTPLWRTKVSKVKHFLEGSGHQNFMNPLYMVNHSIAERAVPDSEPVPVQRGDGAFISSGFSPECISLCVVVSESKAH